MIKCFFWTKAGNITTKWISEKYLWSGTPHSQSARTGGSPSDCFVSYYGHCIGGVLHLWRDTVGVFYSLIGLGMKKNSCEEVLCTSIQWNLP